jgi:hypothetical protein
MEQRWGPPRVGGRICDGDVLGMGVGMGMGIGMD